MCYYCKTTVFPNKNKNQEGPGQNMNKAMGFPKTTKTTSARCIHRRSDKQNAVRLSLPLWMHLADALFNFVFRKNHGVVNVLSRAFLIVWFVGQHCGFARITHTHGQADTPDRRTRRPGQTNVYFLCIQMFPL